MSDSTYGSVIGLVDFEPSENTTPNGHVVRNVNIVDVKTGKTVQISVWDQFSHVEISKGSIIGANGKTSSREGQLKSGEKKTFYSLSAYSLVVVPPAIPVKKDEDEPDSDPGF